MRLQLRGPTGQKCPLGRHVRFEAAAATRQLAALGGDFLLRDFPLAVKRLQFLLAGPEIALCGGELALGGGDISPGGFRFLPRQFPLPRGRRQLFLRRLRRAALLVEGGLGGGQLGHGRGNACFLPTVLRLSVGRRCVHLPPNDGQLMLALFERALGVGQLLAIVLGRGRHVRLQILSLRLLPLATGLLQRLLLEGKFGCPLGQLLPLAGKSIILLLGVLFALQLLLMQLRAGRMQLAPAGFQRGALFNQTRLPALPGGIQFLPLRFQRGLLRLQPVISLGERDFALGQAIRLGIELRGALVEPPQLPFDLPLPATVGRYLGRGPRRSAGRRLLHRVLRAEHFQLDRAHAQVIASREMRVVERFAVEPRIRMPAAHDHAAGTAHDQAVQRLQPRTVQTQRATLVGSD